MHAYNSSCYGAPYILVKGGVGWSHRSRRAHQVLHLLKLELESLPGRTLQHLVARKCAMCSDGSNPWTLRTSSFTGPCTRGHLGAGKSSGTILSSPPNCHFQFIQMKTVCKSTHSPTSCSSKSFHGGCEEEGRTDEPCVCLSGTTPGKTTVTQEQLCQAYSLPTLNECSDTSVSHGPTC